MTARWWISLAPENRHSPYNSDDYRYSPSVHPKIVAAQGGVYGHHLSVEPTLGFVNVRDNVLDVTNGTVTAVRRTDPQGSALNGRWEITVAPTGDAAVTVALSPTTDCSANSAVCTSYGKMLSNSASITIAGP